MPVLMRSNFVKGSGRHKKSFSPKQNGNYKPSYFRSIQKNKPKVPMRQKQDVVNTDVCHDESYPEVLLSDRRCYDNALRVQIGNVRAVTLVDSGVTVSCISHDLLSKIQPNRLQYLPGDISKVYGVGNIVQEISTKVRF